MVRTPGPAAAGSPWWRSPSGSGGWRGDSQSWPGGSDAAAPARAPSSDRARGDEGGSSSAPYPPATRGRGETSP